MQSEWHPFGTNGDDSHSKGGKLDQSCEVLSKKNHLLYLNTKDDSYELILTSEKIKPYKVAIFFSGLERSLKNS